jgi:hypothetical protein
MASAAAPNMASTTSGSRSSATVQVPAWARSGTWWEAVRGCWAVASASPPITYGGCDWSPPTGRLREVTAETEPDLIWAVRGGKDNFGLVQLGVIVRRPDVLDVR